MYISHRLLIPLAYEENPKTKKKKGEEKMRKKKKKKKPWSPLVQKTL
jgi:hypothetical protein